MGGKRERFETPLPQRYYDAFEAIDQDDNQEVVVMEDNGELIGTLQLTILPYLTYEGGTRGLIEAVRIAAGRRGGSQPTRSSGAVEFYQKLGFKATHEGMKLHLEGNQ